MSTGSELHICSDPVDTSTQWMFLSEHTVQDHLKSIFAKTGTRNRRTLLARTVGS